VIVMTQWHLRSHRKPTGGLLRTNRKKRKDDRGSDFLETKIGKKRVKITKTAGGGIKLNLLAADTVNVADPKTGKITKTKVLGVAENPANTNYVRRNVITKGAVVKTELGLARVTSRPGQSGVLNAVLVEEKK